MSINDALANSIAAIVDDRVRDSFSERDSVLSQMHQSLQDVASLLRDRTLQMQTLKQSMDSPDRHRLGPPKRREEGKKNVLKNVLKNLFRRF